MLDIYSKYCCVERTSDTHTHRYTRCANIKFEFWSNCLCDSCHIHHLSGKFEKYVFLPDGWNRQLELPSPFDGRGVDYNMEIKDSKQSFDVIGYYFLDTYFLNSFIHERQVSNVRFNCNSKFIFNLNLGSSGFSGNCSKCRMQLFAGVSGKEFCSIVHCRHPLPDQIEIVS